MKRNLSDYLVALAVIGCSLVLLAAMTMALSGYRVKKPTRTLEIDFSDIAGIKLHSEVRYAGAPAGRVIAVRHLSPAERASAQNRTNAVRVTVSVQENVPPLPADTVASLGSDTLLSEKFVALSGGTPGGPVLANRSVIQGQPAFGIERLAQQAGPLIENANGLLTHADEIMVKLKGDLNDLLPKLSGLVDSVQALSGRGQSLLGHADKLIANNEGDIKTNLEQLKVVLKQADASLKRASDFIGNANSFVGSTDRQLQERLKEMRVVMQNLKVVTTHAKAITEALGEKPSRLLWGVGKPNKLTPESAILRSSEPLPARAN